MSVLPKIIAFLSASSRSLSTGRRQLGVALMRIVLGSVMTVLYGLHFSQRHFLWGADAVLSHADSSAILAARHTWSLYAIFPSALGAECLYWVGLIVALMFAAGLFTRVSSIGFFILTWSLYQRNPYTLNGGDNLLVILSIYLIFADLSALSLDRRLFGEPRESRFAWLAGMLHNFALAACLLQLGILYFEAGFYKIQGHVWSSGTAIYYILRSNGFALPGWGDYIWRSAALVTIGTYGTVLFEISHPFLMWDRRLKYLVFSGAVLLHASIGILMGLVWFSVTMIGAHAVLFDDDEYVRLHDWSCAAWRKIVEAFRRSLRVRARSYDSGGVAEPVGQASACDVC
jgi:Vitamin K-dependent gamma-carboxylase